jgi:peptidoglycan/LPS O-acetylase OafA/YrhL/lysophospholipase L1-like esterase
VALSASASVVLASPPAISLEYVVPARPVEANGTERGVRRACRPEARLRPSFLHGDAGTGTTAPLSAPHRVRVAHLPALDGLRGLAVLGVLFFHAEGALPGGYLGVDLFFVLSGYLITTILLAEHAASGRIDLGQFWVRRARRLFPALLSLMPAIALYARYVAKPDELGTLRGDALATLAYVANWRAVLSNKSYWELFAAPSPLEHTWSLAIEEQFYVVWPLLVVLVLGLLRRSRRALLVVSAVLMVLSAGAMVVLFDADDTSRVYFGTDTRASAILAGAVLAVVLPPDTSLRTGAVRLLDGLGAVALLGLGCAWALLDGQSAFLYHGGFWLTELAGLVLIGCAVAGPRSLVARALAARPLTLAGTISYGLYLWHWPVNCVLTAERLRLGALPVSALRFFVAFAIATLSYVFFEKPIRTRGVFFGRPVVVVPAATLASVLVVLGGTAVRPAPSPPPPSPRPIAAAAPSAGPRWTGIFDVDSRTLPPAKDIAPGAVRIVVLGDSVASKLGVAMRYRQEEAGAFVAERGVGDCSILSGVATTQLVHGRAHEGNSCSAAWRADVEELRPDVTLIVLGGGYYSKVLTAAGWQAPCQRGWADVYRARLDALVGEIQKDAGRIVVARVPYPVGRWRSRGLLERVDCFNDVLSSVAKARGLSTLDLMSHVCPTKDCNLTSKDEPIRPDGLHFDGVGAEESALWTLREIQRMTEPARAVTR